MSKEIASRKSTGDQVPKPIKTKKSVMVKAKITKKTNKSIEKGTLADIIVKDGKSTMLVDLTPVAIAQNRNNAPDSKMKLIGRITQGVSKNEWKSLIQFTGATEKEFENILPVSISSMQKRNVYGMETSERIFELAELFGLGYDVFDTKEDFKNWLVTPLKTLGNLKPFELLRTSYGFKVVENEINRIRYNVYS